RERGWKRSRPNPKAGKPASLGDGIQRLIVAHTVKRRASALLNTACFYGRVKFIKRKICLPIRWVSASLGSYCAKTKAPHDDSLFCPSPKRVRLIRALDRKISSMPQDKH